ncbi:WD40-repeat-containing domain protein [Suillus paluster]|uniref:WD40-repeat-containing domain protein n=1 Tax=Suillus paluster TaxID=48578 RepID=UPI001B87888D|nr:WD40-repeat-containing domain protein [Suillus paluster]KAG1746620.1 WD40-repeat-containing domain protein [Suillus paluster]
MSPNVPAEVIDVDALSDEDEIGDAILYLGSKSNVQHANATGRRTKNEPVASSSRLPPNFESINNHTYTYTRPGLSETVEQERRRRIVVMERQGEPPSKKRATSSTIAMTNMPSRQQEKRKQPSGCKDIIDLCSSDDDIHAKKRLRSEDNNLYVDRATGVYANNENAFQMDCSDDIADNHKPNDILPRTNAPSSLSQPPSSEDQYDSEEEYANYIASLNISNESNVSVSPVDTHVLNLRFQWKPVPTSNKAEDLSPNMELEVEPARPPPGDLRPQRPKYRAVHYPVTPLDPSLKEQYFWGRLNSVRGFRPRALKPPARLRIASRLPGRTRSLKLFQDLAYDNLGAVQSHRQAASGSLNKIVQVPGAIVACAAASGGHADYSQEDREAPLPSDNNPGTLVVLHQGRCHVVDAHCIDHGASSKKYYTINDVLFNPLNPEQFLSTGHDFQVQLWQLPKVDDIEMSESGAPWMTNTITLGDVAQDLVHSPDGANLAVSCRDGTVSVFKTTNLFASPTWHRTTPSPLGMKLCVAPAGENHAAEPHDSDGEGKDKGFHRAHDITRGRELFRFSANEAGDAGAVSPDGSTYVLITCGENNQHPIRLYDVARKSGDPVAQMTLEPSVSKVPSFEATATFSSEGRLLAVARSDNVVHMYDIRSLSKGPLAMFKHGELDTVSAGYGVVQACWVEGRDRRRVGIVSGGNDGCVRLWDPLIASSDKSQGKVLAHTDFDVACFSMGDMWAGEKPLVLGHCGGGLYVYDHLDSDGLPGCSNIDIQ